MLNAIRLYRLANWLYRHHIPLLPKLLQLLIFINYNCSINYRMKIGRGTFSTTEEWACSLIPKPLSAITVK